MIEIKDLFGEGAKQTGQYLIINKSNLDIIPSATNTAESLFAAIIIKASKQYLGVLTDQNGIPVTDPKNNILTYDNRGLFDSTRLTYYARYLPVGLVRDVFEFLEFIPHG